MNEHVGVIAENINDIRRENRLKLVRNVSDEIIKKEHENFGQLVTAGVIGGLIVWFLTRGKK